MTYAHVIAGAVTAYPYSFSQMQADNPNKTFDTSDPINQAIENGRYPVVNTPPPFNPHHQTVVEKDKSEWVVGEQNVQITYDVNDIPLEDCKNTLINLIEEKRWEVETGGMTFNGYNVPTDDRSKTLILGARTAAMEQGDSFYDEWKVGGAGQYLSLNAEAAIAMGDALLGHVRASFTKEKELVLEVLAADTYEELEIVRDSLNDGWPS